MTRRAGASPLTPGAGLPPGAAIASGAFAEWLAEASGQRLAQKVYVDTGAILERSHAQQAGMGFIGKNTMLIHPRRGSSFFIGEIISALEFDDYDEPHRETMCGTCTRCMAACPTDAFPAPYVLDSRRCISYHTIENKGWIDRDLRADFANWIFGCDICQDVCPFQRFAEETDEVAFLPFDMDRVAPKLTDILMSSAESFRAMFRRTPVERVGRERIVRNACIAAGNWKNERAIPHLIQLLYDENALVRGHAAWALWQTMEIDCSKLLTDLHQRGRRCRRAQRGRGAIAIVHFAPRRATLPTSQYFAGDPMGRPYSRHMYLRAAHGVAPTFSLRCRGRRTGSPVQFPRYLAGGAAGRPYTTSLDEPMAAKSGYCRCQSVAS